MKRGLKGRVVAKKTEEMKDELQATAALIQQYVPPASDQIQVVMNAGTASVGQAGPELLAFTSIEHDDETQRMDRWRGGRCVARDGGLFGIETRGAAAGLSRAGRDGPHGAADRGSDL
jgi:hypothetical protein